LRAAVNACRNRRSCKPKIAVRTETAKIQICYNLRLEGAVGIAFDNFVFKRALYVWEIPS
jgi:hypothetical protein